MTQLQVFDNAKFGRIRIVDNEGSLWFIAKDIAEILEYGKTNDMTRRLKDSEKAKIKAGDLNTSASNPQATEPLTIISEAGLYRAIFGSKKPEAEAFQDWVYNEVLPQIRKTGTYSLPTKDIYEEHPLMVMTRNFLRIESEQQMQKEKIHALVTDSVRQELERRLLFNKVEVQEEQLKEEKILREKSLREIKAKTDAILSQTGYYSIVAFANIKGIKMPINLAGLLGKKATALSRAYNLKIGKVPDTRWGSVGSYHESILETMFNQEGLLGDCGNN